MADRYRSAFFDKSGLQLWRPGAKPGDIEVWNDADQLWVSETLHPIVRRLYAAAEQAIHTFRIADDTDEDLAQIVVDRVLRELVPLAYGPDTEEAKADQPEPPGTMTTRALAELLDPTGVLDPEPVTATPHVHPGQLATVKAAALVTLVNVVDTIQRHRAAGGGLRAGGPNQVVREADKARPFMPGLRHALANPTTAYAESMDLNSYTLPPLPETETTALVQEIVATLENGKTVEAQRMLMRAIEAGQLPGMSLGMSSDPAPPPEAEATTFRDIRDSYTPPPLDQTPGVRPATEDWQGVGADPGPWGWPTPSALTPGWLGVLVARPTPTGYTTGVGYGACPLCGALVLAEVQHGIDLPATHRAWHEGQGEAWPTGDADPSTEQTTTPPSSQHVTMPTTSDSDNA